MNEKAATIKAEVKTLVETLAAETDAARQSDQFKNFLDTCAMFHDYSWHNCALIWSKKPNAPRVAGFRTWQKMNRFVMKGETGIPIFAPMFFKDKAAIAAGAGENEAKRLGFRIVYVFDISQTDGQPLPELPDECAGEHSDWLVESLEAIARKKSICVKYEPIETAAKGYAHRKGSEIVIDSELPAADRAAVLIHELTHCLSHFGDYKPSQKQRELEAEAASYVIASHFGLKPRSEFYLASYGVTAADLMNSLETVQKTAQEIIGLVEEHDATGENVECSGEQWN